MAKKSDFEKWADSLPFDERLTHARQSLQSASNVAHFLVALHETNQIVVYSDLLSSQVGRSYAANSYNNFRRALQEIELVRLCSLWDRAEQDAFSIPTVIDLIDNNDVIDCVSRLAAETRRYIPDDTRALGDTEEERQIIRRLLIASGERDARRERRKICVLTRRTIREARSIFRSDVRRNVVNFRNKYIAHATDLTRRERDEGNGPLPLPKFGDETVHLAQTLKIMKRLDLCIRGVSFDWSDSERIAQKNAEALWRGVTIKILR